MWWLVPATSALGSVKQEDCFKFEVSSSYMVSIKASLNYRVRLGLKKKNQEIKKHLKVMCVSCGLFCIAAIVKSRNKQLSIESWVPEQNAAYACKAALVSLQKAGRWQRL